MQLDQDKVSQNQRKYEYIMECRYLGQGFELRAKMPSEELTKDNVNVIIDNFYDVHKQQYGHAFKDQITEAITIRVVASVDTEKLEFTKLKAGGNENPIMQNCIQGIRSLTMVKVYLPQDIAETNYWQVIF